MIQRCLRQKKKNKNNKQKYLYIGIRGFFFKNDAFLDEDNARAKKPGNQ